MILEKIISGGQTGADEAGLKVAKALGLKTGGWLTKGCRTLEGPKSGFLIEYGMQEHTSEHYARRTEYNVRDSDGTVRFAKTFKSQGEKCTLNAIKWFRRPYFDINILKPPTVEEFIQWLVEKRIKVLNVAGNAEETAPGIGAFVEDYLTRAIRQMKMSGQDSP